MLRRRLTEWREAMAYLGARLETVVGALLALALVMPVIGQGTYYLAENADTRAVIGARDEDAGNAIDIAGHSHWYSSNGFYPYGPVYFRVAHVIGAAMSPVSQPGDLPADEARSKAMHLGLMMTSLAALVALGFLLAGAWTSVWWARLGLSAWITGALLRAPAWRTMLLQAHPDHLLAFATALATWATARAWRDPDRRAHRLAAWAWGLALAVKMTLLMWLPFLIVSLVWPWRRGRVREAIEFAAHAAGVFFLVGFPQNFNFYKIIRFLCQQSLLSAPATGASVREWLVNWTSQLGWPLGVLVVGAVLIFLADRRRRFPVAWGGWRAWALGLGPLGVLGLQSVLAPHDHYPMPVVATQLALVASALSQRRFADERALLGLMFASVVAFSFFPAIPKSIGDTLNEKLMCRPQAREVGRRFKLLRARDVLIHVDPYVPVMSHLPKVKSTWQMSHEYLATHRFDALVISWNFAGRYLGGELSDYVKRDNPEWAKAVETYAAFRGRERVELPGAGVYRRTWGDDCGWEFWERAD